MDLKVKNNIFGYFRFYYSVLGNKLIFSVILSFFVSLLDGFGLAMFMPLLHLVSDANSKNASASLGNLKYLTDALESLNISLNVTNLLIILITLFSLKGLLKFYQLNYQVNLRQLFMSKIRFHLTQQLQDLSYEGFLSFNSGKIQNSLTNEVIRLRAGLVQFMTSTQAVIMLSTYIILAFFANWQFAILVSAGALLSNLLFVSIFRYTKRASVKLSKKGDHFNSYLIHAIHYFKYLKSTNTFKNYSIKLRKNISETELLNRKIGFYQAITSSVKEPVLIVIISMVILIQVKWFGTNMSTIILSLLLFYRALTFLMNLQNTWQAFIQNIGAMFSISEISDELKKRKENLGNKNFDRITSSLNLRNVSLSYGEKQILRNINLEIKKNQSIALVGESGSGKSTLSYLISGLIKPTSGTYTVDGVDINDLNLDDFRTKIGFISQDPVVFNDTIFNNITFWDNPTNENLKRFNEVIQLTYLSDFVNSLSEKENTYLGDHGILISGGQKQRISIARELYKNVELLILDEATSSLDSETEQIIQQNIEKLHGNVTMIIIAHRLSTIRNADSIYLMEKGNLMQSGTFDELMERSDHFRRMVELQEI